MVLKTHLKSVVVSFCQPNWWQRSESLVQSSLSLLKRGVREKGGGLMFALEILHLLIKKESFHTLHVSDQLEQEVQCFWTFEKFLLYV